MSKAKKLNPREEEGVHKINIEETDIYTGKEEVDLEVIQMIDTTIEEIIIILDINSPIIPEIINIIGMKEIEVEVLASHRRKVIKIKSKTEIHIKETDDEHIIIIY